MGRGGNGCGLGLLKVTSNKLVTFPRRHDLNENLKKSGVNKLLCFPRVYITYIFIARRLNMHSVVVA